MPPLINELFDLLEKQNRSLHQVETMSGVAKSTLQRWKAMETTPKLLNFNSVLNVLGYQLTIERKGRSEQ